MTFEEMQSIMQSVVISQREMQAEMQANQREMQATQREIQANQQEMQSTLRETQHLAQSIARGVQAMQDKALSDELKREEERAEHQAQMAQLRQISQGLVNMLSSIDEDRPTILRKLNAIAEGRSSTNENKTDTIIDRLSRD